MAFVGALGIRERLAVAIDHPTDRHRLAALGFEPHLAVSRNGRRHVEHDRRLLECRDRNRKRIGAEQTFAAAPRRQMIVAAHREVEADHVVRERHRDIQRRGPGMIAHARPDPTDAGRLGFFDRQSGSAPHHQMTQAIVAVDQRH
jgi:hypothetical protein